MPDAEINMRVAGWELTVRKKLPYSMVAGLVVWVITLPEVALLINRWALGPLVLVGAHLLLWLGFLATKRMVRKAGERTAIRTEELTKLAQKLSDAVADKDVFDSFFVKRWSPHLKMHGLDVPSGASGWDDYIFGILPYLNRGDLWATKREAKRLAVKREAKRESA